MAEMKKKRKSQKGRWRYKKKLGCGFLRINPDAKNCEILVKVGKIQNHITESTKQLAKNSTKKSLFDKISKSLNQNQDLKRII